MKTTLSLLLQRLRGQNLVGRPGGSSVSYAMPQPRRVVAALAVAVAMHSGFFFGFNSPAPLPPPPPPQKKEKPPAEREPERSAEVVRLIEQEETEKPPTDQRNTPDTTAASQEEPNGAPMINGVTIVIDRPTPPIAPRPDAPNWGIPKTTERLGQRPTGKEEVFRVAEVMPAPLSQMAPPYPFDERQQGREGVVVVRFVVTRAGATAQVEAVSATSPAFARAALEAVAQWRFEPGRKNGRRVNVLMEVPVNFSLAKDS
jgi:protein TonB